MAINRESIFVALQSRLQTKLSSSVYEVTRRPLPTATDGQVANPRPDVQPCVYIAQSSEHAEGMHGEPRLWTIDAKLYVYAFDGNDVNGPAPTVNQILGLIEDALTSQASDAVEGKPFDMGQVGAGPTTLGGLVSDVEVTDILLDEGIFGRQGFAAVTLRIRVF